MRFLHTGLQARSSEGRDTCRQTLHGGCKVLVDALVVRIAEVEMETVGKALVEVEAKALVDTSFEKT